MSLSRLIGRDRQRMASQTPILGRQSETFLLGLHKRQFVKGVLVVCRVSLSELEVYQYVGQDSMQQEGGAPKSPSLQGSGSPTLADAPR